MAEVDAKYKGLCLAGPHDGKHVCGDTNVLLASEKLGNSWDFDPRKDVASKAIADNRFTYIYFQAVEYGFWVPSELLTKHTFDGKSYPHPMGFVVEQLMKHYKPGGDFKL